MVYALLLNSLLRPPALAAHRTMVPSSAAGDQDMVAWSPSVASRPEQRAQICYQKLQAECRTEGVGLALCHLIPLPPMGFGLGGRVAEAQPDWPRTVEVPHS